MKYVFRPMDPNRYASALQLDTETGKLNWNSANSKEMIVLQTPYGQRPMSQMESTICPALCEADLMQGQYVEVLPGIWARKVTDVEKVQMGGCPLNGEGATYTVFAVFDTQDGIVEVYESPETAMYKPYIDVPLEIEVAVEKVSEPGGFFGTKKIDTGFFRVSFSRGSGSAYADGDISYQAEDLEIPVTKQAIDARTFFIKSTSRPVFSTQKPGIHLSQHSQQ